VIPVPRFEKFLNYLLIFLLPTQLAIHFWPPSAFVFGIRVDYLSPTIYLTDILFTILFVSWIRANWRQVGGLIRKYKNYLIPLVAIALINIAFSEAPQPSIYKWVKIFELLAFGYYVWARREVFNTKIFLNTLYYSLLFFSVIGIVQFFLGKTIGGPFYLLGERSFNISTPGIALVDLFGKVYMRAYSTFSHPNSFAGYLVLGFIVLMFSYSRKEIFKRALGLSVIIFATILTFSFSAILGFIFCGTVFIFQKLNLLSVRKNVLILSSLFLISMSLPFVSGLIKERVGVLSSNVSQRLDLSFKAGKVISSNFLFGSGLNTFVVTQPMVSYSGDYIWLLQPVHNVYLLIFSELGVVGLICVFVLLVKTLQNAIYTKSVLLIFSIFFILATGLFDHYWLTLQQNMFIMILLLSSSLREKR